VQKISEGLAGRQWVVLVMTPAAVRSPWVQREVNAAMNEHTARRMLGILPVVMQPCNESDIPILWRPIYRYDATKSYEVARDGLFAALGLSQPAKPVTLPPESDATKTKTGIRLAGRYVDVAFLKTLDGLMSLSPWEFEEAVALMLAANGYRKVRLRRPEESTDLVCVDPAGRTTFVTCKKYALHHQVHISKVQTLVASGMGRPEIPMLLFITTSRFMPEALLLQRASPNLTLIDGPILVDMMQLVEPNA
jgi:hypothetical protein